MLKSIQPNFKNKDTLEDKFWWAMCECNMSMPVSLRKADLTKPFVYYRKYGVFYVPFGKHQLALSQLLAWDLGYENFTYIDENLLNIGSDICDFADYFLEHTVGTAFKSTQSDSVMAGRKSSLNSMEVDYFSSVNYMLSN
jgi:hypothetical protein